MRYRLLPLTGATLALLAGSTAAMADTRLGDYFSVSGFGSLGWARTDTDAVKYGRDRQLYGGASTNGTFDVDSNLGLQATATATDWLSATGQLVTVKRQLENHLTTEAEWGFVKVTPLQGLSIRGGRMPIPVFMVSDSVNIGYANTWLRAPNEVYGLVSFRRLQGFDVSYQMPIGSSMTLTATALSGTSRAPTAFGNFKMNNVGGGNLVLETPWATFRAGQLHARYGTAAAPGYTFESLGVAVDRNDIVFQAETVKKIVPTIPTATANGSYAMAGYRVTPTILPFVMYGKTDPKTVSASNVTDKQKTASLGLRWDAFKSVAIKAQFDHVDTEGTKGASFVGLKTSGSNSAPAIKSPVNVISTSVSFVF